jgi:hypothetical protein
MASTTSHQTADELRSELISQLYQYNVYSEGDIFTRIKLVESPIFIKPLIDLYDRNKHLNNGIRDTALNALSDYDTPLVREFILKEAEGLNDVKSIRDIIPALSKLNIYSKHIEDKLLASIEDFYTSYQTILYYPVVRDVTNFLKQNNRLSTAYSILYPKLLENTKLGEVFTGIMLDDVFDSNPKQAIIDLANNFNEKIKGTSLERAIAQRCTKPEFEELKKLIQESGSIESKLIINKKTVDYYKYLGAYNHVQFDLGKVQTIYEIIHLRKDINKKLKTTKDIFIDDELIIEQAKKISSPTDLVAAAVNLRDYITNIDDTFKISLIEDIKKRILPNALPGAYNLSLNRLILFLNQKGVSVNDQLLGIKKIYYLTTLLGSHAKSVKNKEKVLKELKIYELYENKQYDHLHLEILKQYKEGLNLLNLSIT